MSVSNRILVCFSIVCAFLPLFAFWIVLQFAPAGPIWGGLLFNPVILAAYLWLGVTILSWYRLRSRAAIWLFLGFPIAFAAPAIGILFRLAWMNQSFGH
jgi:hypothetical protein